MQGLLARCRKHLTDTAFDPQVDVTDEQLAVVVLDLLRAYPGGLSDAILLTEVTKAFSSKKGPDVQRKRKHDSRGPSVQTSAYHQPVGTVPDALPSNSTRDQGQLSHMLPPPGHEDGLGTHHQQQVTLPGQVPLSQLTSSRGLQSLQTLPGLKTPGGHYSVKPREPVVTAAIQEARMLGGAGGKQQQVSASGSQSAGTTGTWAVHVSDGSMGPAASLAVILHSNHSFLAQPCPGIDPNSVTHEGCVGQAPPRSWLHGKRLRAAGITLSPVPLTLGLHGTGSTSSNGSNGSSNILKFAVPPRAVVYELPELRVQYSSASTGTSHAEQPVVSSPKETTCANLAVAEGGLTRSLGHVHAVAREALAKYQSELKHQLYQESVIQGWLVAAVVSIDKPPGNTYGSQAAHGRYPPTHATVRLTPLHPAGRDEQGGELAGQVDLVLHGEDALVADLLLPGETMALLNPVLGITLSLPGSACQGGMQATGDCQQAIQGAGAGPTYQAWLHLGSQKVVVVAASQPEYQVQQQAMAGTNTDAQRGTVDQQAVPCAAAQHHVTGRVATSGTVPAGLVWGQVVRVSQCTSRWQGGGRVPVVTGELRVLGPSPDCRTCILQLELEQSSKVAAQLRAGHSLLLLGGIWEHSPPSATTGAETRSSAAPQLLSWKEGAPGAVLVNLSTLPALLGSPCLWQPLQRTLAQAAEMAAGDNCSSMGMGASASVACDTSRLDGSRDQHPPLCMAQHLQPSAATTRSTGPPLAAQQWQQAAGLAELPVVCTVQLVDVDIGVERVHKFCGKPVLREVLDFGSDDDDGDAGMEDVGAPGGSAPAPDPLSHEGLWRCNFCGIECSGCEVQWRYTGTATLIDSCSGAQLQAPVDGQGYSAVGMQVDGQACSKGSTSYRVPHMPLGPAAVAAVTNTTADVWAALSAKERSRRVPGLVFSEQGQGSEAALPPGGQLAAVAGQGLSNQIQQGAQLHVSQLAPCLGQEADSGGDQRLWLACIAWG